MFGFNIGEMMLIAAIALVAIGPKQLPEVARTIGKLLNEFKRATGEFHKNLNDANDSTAKTIAEVHQTFTQAVHPVRTSLDQMNTYLHQQVSPMLSGQSTVTQTQIAAAAAAGVVTEEISPQASFPMSDLGHREIPAGDGANQAALDEHQQLSFDFKNES